MDETLTLLKDRCGSEVAVSFRQDLEASPRVRILWVDGEDGPKAWKIFRTHKDKTYSSINNMEKYAIKNSFAYDEHFAQPGLNKLP